MSEHTKEPRAEMLWLPIEGSLVCFTGSSNKSEAVFEACWKQINRVKLGATLRQDAQARMTELVSRWNSHAELVEALEGIARRTSACIARNRNEKPDSLLDIHAEIIDVQIKARAALETARAKGEK